MAKCVFVCLCVCLVVQIACSQSGGDYVDELPAPPVCGASRGAVRKIVNGVPAKLGAFPWMAVLGYKAKDSNKPLWLCGGSLVSSLHVLTAAHCINNKQEFLYLVRLGDLDLEKDDDGATPIDVPIKTMIMHEQYNSTMKVNDIAILVLDRHVEFTSLIKPICLPTSDELRSNAFVGENPFIAGWGNTQYHGVSASHLQFTQVRVLESEVCERGYTSYINSGRLVMDEKVLCAGYEEGGKDACQGDSGGPLMRPTFDKGGFFIYQIGVVSFGKGCAAAGYPGIYSRTTYFMPWLQEKITGK